MVFGDLMKNASGLTPLPLPVDGGMNIVRLISYCASAT